MAPKRTTSLIRAETTPVVGKKMQLTLVVINFAYLVDIFCFEIIRFSVFDDGAIKSGGSENMVSPEFLSFGDWGVGHGGLHLRLMEEVWQMKQKLARCP